METVVAYMLPGGKGGYLPYYMLTLSVLALGNSLQNYMTLHYSRRFYNGQFVPNPSLPARTQKYDPDDATDKLVPAATHSTKDGKTVDQVMPLTARLFGTYTVVSAVVRIYASYHLDLEPVYMMALWTYIIALAHFVSEGFVYKTFRLGGPQALPFLFAATGIVWMVAQKDFYVVV